MRIGTRGISEHRTYLLAEVGQAHEGSLSLAREYVRAVASAGCDGVKFQIHLPEAESTLDEPFRPTSQAPEMTRYEYWRRTSFSVEQWSNIANLCQQLEVDFVVTPFSLEATAMVDSDLTAAWKIASTELDNKRLLDHLIRTDKPIIASTGVATWRDIDSLVAHLGSSPRGFALLQTTSAYPTQLDLVGFNVMAEMRDRYSCPSGLSDHSGDLATGLTAVSLGAAIYEAHVLIDDDPSSIDREVSLTVDEFAFLSAYRDKAAILLHRPIDKDEVSAKLRPTLVNFFKSLAPARDLPAGTVLQERHLCLKKPGTGIQPDRLAELVGRRLVNDVTANRLLRWEDIE